MMHVDTNKGKLKKSVTLEVIGAHDYFELTGLLDLSISRHINGHNRNHCHDMTTDMQKACLARIPAHQAGQGTNQTWNKTAGDVTQYFLSTASSLSVEMALPGRLFRINIQ